MTATWRLLVTEPCDGATNMAIDEAVWRGRQAGTSPSTVRFFAWAPPTVSLGYGQPLDRDVSVEACRRLGVGLVRRPAGGSAAHPDGPAPRLRTLFPTTRDPLATLTTLEAALGHRPKFDDVAAALAHAFEREHGLRLRADGLTADETAHAARLVEEKYATAEWLAGPV